MFVRSWLYNNKKYYIVSVSNAFLHSALLAGLFLFVPGSVGKFVVWHWQKYCTIYTLFSQCHIWHSL